jgi:hypothetical protein
VRGATFSLPSQPLAVGRRRVEFVAACFAEDEEEPEACSGTIKLRETRGRHRLIARGTFASGGGRDARIVRARLNARGRQLVSRRRGVVADVSYRSRSKDNSTSAKADWALRLRRGR